MELANLHTKVKQHFDKPTKQPVDSYQKLRQAIGVIGLALPWAVWAVAVMVFSQHRQASISAFYYTGSRDLFVGMLSAVGVFLLFYQGPQNWDSWVSTVAGACAVGVAMFPVKPECQATPIQEAVSNWHIGFATSFFVLITILVLVFFTRSGRATPGGKARFVTYWVCGVIMAGCVVILLLRHFTGDKAPCTSDSMTYWLELTAIEAFGVAWLVKGGWSVH